MRGTFFVLILVKVWKFWRFGVEWGEILENLGMTGGNNRGYSRKIGGEEVEGTLYPLLQHACDCRVRHEKCRGLLKHVLKPYDNRSDGQFYIVEIVYDFSMTRAACAIKIACDNRKQRSYCVNRPLEVF